MGNIEKNTSEIPEERMGEVRDWGEMSHYLPDDINPHDRRYLRAYFRSQIFIADGKPTKARRLFRRLSNWTGYDEFEEKESSIEMLRTVDMGVKGHTRWKAEREGLK